MDPPPANAKAHFLEIFERGPDERAAYLDEHCPDPTLRAEVEELLAAHDRPTHLPELPTIMSPEEAETTVRTSPGRIGEFETIRQLGEGGMGVVYLAREISLDRLVALKVLPGSAASELAVARFRTEARAVAQLHHESIVPIYRVGEEQGRHFIAMEYVEGQTLAETLIDRRVSLRDSDGSFALRRPSTRWHRTAATTLARIGDALEHAHQHGIIHRDVKPTNILMDTEGNPHLTDFGIAKIVTDETLTRTRGLAGTCRYMSPEQARAGQIDLDHRSDIFSLGVVLYESLTFTPPFNGETPDQILSAVITRQPPRLRSIDPSISRDLETICQKALEKDPAHRYQTAAHMAADLRCYVAGSPILARPPSAARRARHWVREHRLQTLAALVVLLLGVVSLLTWLEFDRRRARLCPVTIVTDVAGAEVHCRRVDETTGEPGASRHLGPTPLRERRIEPGLYRFTIVRGNGTFAEATAFLDDPTSLTEIRLSIPNSGAVRADEMARFETGEYHFGRDDGEPFERTRSIPLRAFWIDRYEVSNERYKSFVDATGHRPPHHWELFGYDPELADRPVVGIRWEDAHAYARWIGKRLPTWTEWECAMRSPDGRTLPWTGPEPPGLPVVTTDMIARAEAADWALGYKEYSTHARPVAGEPQLATTRGLHHGFGNVAEMTDSLLFQRSSAVVIKGGTWIDLPETWDLSRVAARPRGTVSLLTGFRCAVSAAPDLDPQETRR